MSKFWSAIIIIAILNWYTFFGVFHRDYTIRLKDVDTTIYKYTMIAAKKGCLSMALFDELNKELGRHGEFEVNIRVEHFLLDHSPERLEGMEVIDRDLRTSGFDTLTITALGRKEHPLSAVLSMTQLGTPTSDRYSFRLVGKASAFIK